MHIMMDLVGETLPVTYTETIVSAYKKSNKLYFTTKISLSENDIKNGFTSEFDETVTYEFQKDSKNGNYVFVKVTTE